MDNSNYLKPSPILDFTDGQLMITHEVTCGPVGHPWRASPHFISGPMLVRFTPCRVMAIMCLRGSSRWKVATWWKTLDLHVCVCVLSICNHVYLDKSILRYFEYIDRDRWQYTNDDTHVTNLKWRIIYVYQSLIFYDYYVSHSSEFRGTFGFLFSVRREPWCHGSWSW